MYAAAGQQQAKLRSCGPSMLQETRCMTAPPRCSVPSATPSQQQVAPFGGCGRGSRSGCTRSGSSLRRTVTAAAVAEDSVSNFTASPSSAATTAWGTELGLPTDFEQRFEVGSQLGVGSFGTVHLAYDRVTGREVAVKQLRKDLQRSQMSRSRGTGRINRQKLLRRLRREIDTLRSVDGCPSAIAFEGAFEDKQHVYLVMEACHGGDLDTLLKACGALGERHAAMVVWEVLSLVGCCHDAGILHGDVKPSNFLLAPGNPLCPVPIPHASQAITDSASGAANMPVQPKFCPLPAADSTASDLRVPYSGGWLKGVDFGCSHEARAGVPLTKMTGTPAFMAPEVYARSFGTQADMWSLGMLAYQTLSNRLPFWQSEDDMHVSDMSKVRCAVDEEPIPLDYGPWLDASPTCLDFVSRLLQHDPAKRMTAAEAQQHPWFAMHAISAEVEVPSNNVVPLSTSSAMQHSEAHTAQAVMRTSPSSDNLAAQAAS